jgi:hypothetical protein
MIAREDSWRNDFFYLFGAKGVHIGAPLDLPVKHGTNGWH